MNKGGEGSIISAARYRRDIQVLRGLSVSAVVLFHASERYFPLGYLGVDVFFVISGFVVTPLILRVVHDKNVGVEGEGLTNLGNFYKRRFYRLAPALASMLTMSCILIFLFGPIADHERFTRQGIATLLLAGNFGAYRFSGNYFSPNPNPLIHTWSLSVEEQIYIVLPLILLLILRKRTSKKIPTVLVLGFMSVISFILFLFPEILEPIYSLGGGGINSADQFSFYSPVARLWQFTLGGLGFLLIDPNWKRIRKVSKSSQFIWALGVLILLFGSFHISLEGSSILATLLAVIAILFRSFDALPNIFIQKLEWLGDRSYSIYLAHMPLLYLAKYSPMTQIGVSQNRNFQTVIAVVVSIGLGAMNYSRIENRFRNRSNGKNFELKTISTAMFFTLVIPLAVLMVMNQGVYHQYWGLNRNIEQPAYAGNLDPKCARDSEVGPPCFYTNPGATKTALLIGDSHAGHIAQAFQDAAKNSNWNAVIWTHSGCPVQFQGSLSGLVADNCIKVNNLMKNWVLVNRPEVIIVSEFVHRDSSQKDLRSSISILHSIVPNILLIGNNPIFPDGKDFMVARPLFMTPYSPPTKFAQSVMQTKDKNASNQLAKWANENGITTMDFDSIFCTMHTCSRWSELGWLYRDSDHFSVSGANLTIPQLTSYLKQLY